MKIITTRPKPDFDDLAACFAAKRLYPDHEIVIEGKPESKVEKFIEEIAPHLFFYHRFEDLELESVSSLVVVGSIADNQLPVPLAPFLERCKKTLFDHLGTAVADRWDKVVSGNYGTSITLLCSILREKRLEVTPEEATFFTVALYRKTLNFSLSTTTPDDLTIGAWLLSLGASLEKVVHYQKFSLTREQRRHFQKFIDNTRVLTIKGVEVAITEAKFKTMPRGIFELIEKLWFTLGADNLIVFMRVGKGVFAVGRAKYSEIDFSEIFSGSKLSVYPNFSLAFYANTDLESVKEKVFKSLRENILSFVQVREVMSSPVRTVVSEMPVKEAAKIMENTGHSSLPVIGNGRLVGIVTLDNVRKAIKHGLKNSPVKEIMQREVLTVKATAPVSEAARKMVENGSGSVLVLDKGILAGIITKSDLMRGVLTKKSRELENLKLETSRIVSLIETNLEPDLVTMLRFLGIVGNQIGMATYVVGGFVRDLLLGRKNYDIDIVVEGDARYFAQTFGRYFEVTCVEHKEFLTTSIFFKNGLRIDVATARTEYYEEPAVLPNVEMSTIKKDLYRRDFSINAMAIKLNQEEFGLLLDFFGCKRDLEKGVIRTLYPLSFVEDPTRILRAIRFEQRFNFRIEEHTLELLKKYVAQNYLERVTGQRLRDELEKIIEEPEPIKAIKRMDELGVLNHLFPHSLVDAETLSMLKRYFNRKRSSSPKPVYILAMILLRESSPEKLDSIVKRYGFPKKFPDWIRKAMSISRELKKIIVKGEQLSYRIFFETVRKPEPEILWFIDAFLDEENSKKFQNYLQKLEKEKPKITGSILIDKFGLKEGKEIKKILDKLQLAKLEGLPDDEEESFVRRLLGRD
ncbi:hypothetical protein AT15_07180 [Kosmotoga arenicorallina S304]|uniref:CBS domain-containing protein n=1 Tax=Kosmotoga arenicorallina S304 TaxID=1453497 RepID=A0A182C725_9BACT|nr:CBS domain-containing protein [Kosmotoga arenicorallina]OAA31271.1 hypothetical protein AT15_07180 [Kosmotoga arenicorallina S304]